MQFEHRGEKFGLSMCGNDFHFYTEKVIRTKKPQIKLNAKTLKEAEKEVRKLIDKKLSVKK